VVTISVNKHAEGVYKRCRKRQWVSVQAIIGATLSSFGLDFTVAFIELPGS